jgi:hypothetical protein
LADVLRDAGFRPYGGQRVLVREQRDPQPTLRRGRSE